MCLCVYVCVHACVCAGKCRYLRSQKRASDSLEMELGDCVLPDGVAGDQIWVVFQSSTSPYTAELIP